MRAFSLSTLGFKAKGSIVGAPENFEINDVLFSFKKIQRTNEPVLLEAIPVGVTVTDSRWEIRTKSGDLVGLSFNLTASIPITEVGYYDLYFKCKTGTDQYVRKWEDIFVWYPKFTEAEADIVVNLASGDYFNNFAAADNSGLKIYVKGSGTATFYPLRLHGSAGYENYVRIQKEIGNDPITMTYSGGSTVGMRLDAARYVMVDGYNDDGTRGWRLRSSGVSFDVRQQWSDIISTNLHIMGLDIEGDNTGSGAGVRFEVPPANVTFNASTGISLDNAIFDCRIAKSGAEGIYLAYTNDQPQGGYTPMKMRNTVIAWNDIIDSGNDGIQPCSNINIRVHDNTITNWGVAVSQFHENAISWNHGNSGRCFNNFAINGKMGINITSGLYPYDIFAGDTTPQKLQIYNNVLIEGNAPSGGVTETYFNFGQVTNGGSGNTAEWPVEIFNNTIVSNKLNWGWGFSTGGWSVPNFKLFNNIFVKTGNAGEYPEMNWMFDGAYPTNPTVNNLVREFSNYSDIGFDVNYRVPSLSSPAYSGASNTASLISGIDLNDKDGLPLLGASSYAHGAYSGYNFKTITPTVDDAAAATFTVAPSVGSINESGGTLSFTANKPGLLYYVVVANDAAAPSISTILEGNAIYSNGSASSSGLVTGLSPATAYDLYCVFKTRDFVVQSASTKVDFTTISDVVAPTLSGWEITNAQPGRIYFNSSEPITASTFGGFTVDRLAGGGSKTFNGVVINTGQTTGHYLTVSVPFTAADYLVRIAYSGSGSNLQDIAGNPLTSFSATNITNNIVATAVQINLTQYSSNLMPSASWNNTDFNGDVTTLRTMIANLKTSENVLTGYALELTDGWSNMINTLPVGEGVYISGLVNVRGLEVFGNSGGGESGALRISGMPIGASFDIIYLTKSNLNTPAGNVNINGAGAVAYTSGTNEYKQSGTVNGSGEINIVMTNTVASSAACLTGFIVMIGASAAEEVVYIYPDDAPVFTDSITLASNQVAVAGQLRNTDVSGKSEIVLSGSWNDGVEIRSIVGTPEKWAKITNADGNFTGGTPSLTIAHGVRMNNACNYIEFIGKDKDTPFRVSAGGGLSGIVIDGTSPDTYVRYHNVAAYDVAYSGTLINSPTGTITYRKAILSFFKADGLVSDGEGIYLGNTGSTFARVDWGIVVQAGIRNKGREGVQFNHTKYLRMFNSTLRNVGVTIGNPHNHLFQIFCSNGVVENCIFDGGPVMGNFFTHGVTIKNTYFRFTQAGAYVGISQILSYYSEPEFNGQPLLFDNCIIHWDGAGQLPEACWVEERVANVEFRNCIFVGDIATLYKDTRTGHTNTLIGTLTTNGNSVLASLDAPTYISTDYTNKDFLHTNSQYFINRRMGKGLAPTTDLRILEIKEVATQEVIEGTAFGSAGLPATVKVLLPTGNYHDAVVTWNSLDYDPDTLGEQTIGGTITPPANTVNPDNLTISMKVNVVVAPPDNVVLLSLKGTATTDYVTTGNWNHAPQSYASGAIQIKGDSSSQDLASLRDVNGNLTGIGLSTIGTFEGLENIGRNANGVYPAVANKTTWEMQGSTGTTRSFKLTGLNNSIAYKIKVMSSVDPSYASNSQITLAVTGSSGGGTITEFVSYNNVDNLMEFNNVVPSGGEITFAVTRPTSGRTNISVIEINWDNL